MDAAIYGASALICGGVALFASIPLYREVGRIGAGPYAAGALLALWLARRRPSLRARFVLAALVVAGALIVPLSLEVSWRAHTSPGLHVQSEAIITEEAAKALVHGHDPYAATYLHGPLSARPIGTKTHFPYLPAMLVFGIPRAAMGRFPLGDARIAFTVVALALVAAIAWGRRQAGDPYDNEPLIDPSLRLAQALVLVPTGALLLASGGDDVPVAVLTVLALALALRGKPSWSGAVGGLAAAMKQTAWVLLPFLVVGLWRTRGRAAGKRSALAMAAVVLPIVVPFVAWNPGAFFEDVVRFPLGLGRQPSAAETPTLGSLLVHAAPSARTTITLLLGGVVLAVALLLLLVNPPASIAGAAVRAAVVFLLSMALSPAARIGYVVYPVDLLAWAWLARRSAGPTAEPTPALPRTGDAQVPAG